MSKRGLRKEAWRCRHAPSVAVHCWPAWTGCSRQCRPTHCATQPRAAGQTGERIILQSQCPFFSTPDLPQTPLLPPDLHPRRHDGRERQLLLGKRRGRSRVLPCGLQLQRPGQRRPCSLWVHVMWRGVLAMFGGQRRCIAPSMNAGGRPAPDGAAPNAQAVTHGMCCTHPCKINRQQHAASAAGNF